jgi:hypothetical protein
MSKSARDVEYSKCLERFQHPAEHCCLSISTSTPSLAMASANLQTRLTDGQEDGSSGLDDAVWDALQDSDEVCHSRRICAPAMWVAVLSQVPAHAAAAPLMLSR